MRIEKDRILQNRQSSPDTARLHFFCFFRSNILVLQDEFKTIYITQEGMGREQERKGREITMISSDLLVEEDESPSDNGLHELPA